MFRKSREVYFFERGRKKLAFGSLKKAKAAVEAAQWNGRHCVWATEVDEFGNTRHLCVFEDGQISTIHVLVVEN